MANHRRHPEPNYTPPNEVELELGYFLDCPGCERRWSKRYVDRFLDRCIACAREWRRNDRMSRRRGLGGVPLVVHTPPHLFESRALRREVDLNTSEAQKLLAEDAQFRAEVSAYVAKIIASNAKPKTAFYGVLPLLSSSSRHRGKAQRIEIEEEPPTPASIDTVEAVDKHVDNAMNTIDGEIVDQKKTRKHR